MCINKINLKDIPNKMFTNISRALISIVEEDDKIKKNNLRFNKTDKNKYQKWFFKIKAAIENFYFPLKDHKAGIEIILFSSKIKLFN